MCWFAFTRFSNFFFFFGFTIFFTFVYSLYFGFWFKPSHCLPVTMWIYLSQRWNRANTSSFFVILESLNALSTCYVYFLFPLVTLRVLLYFCAFWKKNPAEGKVLSCEIWMKERYRRVFNLSCLIVWLTFYDRALCTLPFFGRKKYIKYASKKLHTISHTLYPMLLLWCLIIFKDLPCTEAEDNM